MEIIKKHNTYSQLRTIRPVTPYPGCDLYYYAIEKGLLDGPADFFLKFKNSDLFTVNFTEISDDKYYELLHKANEELILDHFEHTDMHIGKAYGLITNFHLLYFHGYIKFRGARRYSLS